MDEILLTQQLSATNHEAPELLDSDYDTNNLYQVNKMSLDGSKEKLTDLSMSFNPKRRKNYMGLKIEMI